jgi:hypothetical protein
MKQLYPTSWAYFSGILLEFRRSTFVVTLTTLADGIFFTRGLENVPNTGT